ncbi:MAG: M48 family metallopeptidase [Bacteroidaceae bacterium]|nr:M48 family metallopeptidase [Bacteroidaceae bacterium]
MEAKDVMHPNDAKAIQCMQELKGFNALVRLYMKMGGETLHRGMNLSSMLRVTPDSDGRVYRLLNEVAAKVGIVAPDLYIYNDMDMNAYTYGESRPFVALSSGIVDRMEDDELKGVIAHECGHILCKHSFYTTLMHTMESMGHLFKLISKTLTLPIYLAMTYWSRQSELSADRCAAVVVGNECYQGVLVKLASGRKGKVGHTNTLIEQGREYEAHKRASWWNRLQQEVRCAANTHPDLCVRAMELDRWCHSVRYEELKG